MPKTNLAHNNRQSQQSAKRLSLGPPRAKADAGLDAASKGQLCTRPSGFGEIV
jgi:hypothetical protein